MTLVADGSTVLRIGVGLLLWTSWAPPMAGQEAPSSTSSAGVGLAGVFVVGERADFLDAGWGPTAHLRIDPGGWSGFGGIVEAGWIPLEEDRGRPGQEAENTLAHLPGRPPSLPRGRRRTFSKRGEGHGLLGRSNRGNLTARCGRTPRVTKERRR